MWKNIEINSNSVQTETIKATLIKVPKTEFLFWHPSKLIRKSGKDGYKLSFGYTDNFTFKLFRNGKGKHNSHEKIEEIELSAQDFEKRFFKTEED
ncbi:hypothetical protein [Sulfurimonas sp.]|uniref:hypothetical protein n=1 Tax=Sulfurimonas sp. TaxID=2022749 RepID=UPI002B48D4C3|nr:hypothetical protein [Sulfurimonas sp.]